jgi:hypothetical protein
MRGDNDLDVQLDARIDAALRTYADPGEAPEARIILVRLMERVHEREVRSRKIWNWLIPAAACAAVILIAAALWIHRSPRVLPQQPPIAWTPLSPAGNPAPSAPTSGEAARLAHSPKQVRVRAVPPKSKPLPKLDVFPTPRPLTPEEEQLVAFVRQAPPTAKQEVVTAQQHIADPLQIAELIIRPLDDGDTPNQPKPDQDQSKPDQSRQDQPNGKEQ